MISCEYYFRIHLLELFTTSPREGSAIARRRAREEELLHVVAAIPDFSVLRQNLRKVRLTTKATDEQIGRYG